MSQVIRTSRGLYARPLAAKEEPPTIPVVDSYRAAIRAVLAGPPQEPYTRWTMYNLVQAVLYRLDLPAHKHYEAVRRSVMVMLHYSEIMEDKVHGIQLRPGMEP